MKQYENAPPTAIVPIRVAHIDDDPIFLRCVKDTLELNQKIEIVGQYNSAKSFLKEPFQVNLVDVLIIDYIMPEMNGSELIQELAKQKINIPIISFSSHSFPEYANQLRNDGILHCLSKHQLKSLEPLILKAVNQHYIKPKHRLQNELLAEEVELLLLCCEDYSRDEMSNRLNIGVDAIKARKQLLAQKLGIQNKNIFFLKWAIKNGYTKV